MVCLHTVCCVVRTMYCTVLCALLYCTVRTLHCTAQALCCTIPTLHCAVGTLHRTVRALYRAVRTLYSAVRRLCCAVRNMDYVLCNSVLQIRFCGSQYSSKRPLIRNQFWRHMGKHNRQGGDHLTGVLHSGTLTGHRRARECCSNKFPMTVTIAQIPRPSAMTLDYAFLGGGVLPHMAGWCGHA